MEEKNITLNNKVDLHNNTIRNDFWTEVANFLEKKYYEATTFGEVTLVGDLILTFNQKTQNNKKSGEKD